MSKSNFVFKDSNDVTYDFSDVFVKKEFFVDGTLWSWGYNYHGELGIGTSGNGSNKSSPNQVGSLTNWKQIAAGPKNSMAIKTDGTLWTWGAAFQLPNMGSSSKPVQVGPMGMWRSIQIPNPTWQSVSNEGDSVLAIKADGTLWAWGGNGNGNLGLGDKVYRSSPVQVGNLTNWSKV